ncbi:hypothetical protein SNEBB_002099 [Seison nebaliae]|nr:hypothetical protein SNEBB_002099 [Seison nebaliae]
MLVLFETPAGYAIFNLDKSVSIEDPKELDVLFNDEKKVSKMVCLEAFKKYKDTKEALDSLTCSIEGSLSKCLKKFLKKNIPDKLTETLLVSDSKLGSAIKDKFQMNCLSNSNVQNLMRLIRMQMQSLLKLSEEELNSMRIGLAHSLSRYKLKFSPDKVDTMIVQAISLLDDLDKELNNYIMRCKEWYGWHFPEIDKIIEDNEAYCKFVDRLGDRSHIGQFDFSDILPTDIETEVRRVAEISMGTEISEEDVENIRALCQQILDMNKYRSELYRYLKNRMVAIAPNLTVLVGELIGARLISHAGSLLNLAKHPSSTVQILGAEKALFRALKAKKDTPKYGLLYHASLVSQTQGSLKAKIARSIAAKSSLAIRIDAMKDFENEDEELIQKENETTDEYLQRCAVIGLQYRGLVEQRIVELEGGQKKKFNKRDTYLQYQKANAAYEEKYAVRNETTIVPKRKRKFSDVETKMAQYDLGSPNQTTESTTESKSIKKRKSILRKDDDEENLNEGEDSGKKKKKEKKKKRIEDVEEEIEDKSMMDEKTTKNSDEIKVNQEVKEDEDIESEKKISKKSKKDKVKVKLDVKSEKNVEGKKKKKIIEDKEMDDENEENKSMENLTEIPEEIGQKEESEKKKKKHKETIPIEEEVDVDSKKKKKKHKRSVVQTEEEDIDTKTIEVDSEKKNKLQKHMSSKDEDGDEEMEEVKPKDSKKKRKKSKDKKKKSST